MSYSYDPDFCVPAGATLLEWCQTSSMPDPIGAICRKTGLSRRDFWGLIGGSVEIDDRLADHLADVTKIPKSFWLRSERRYREGLRQGKTPTHII